MTNLELIKQGNYKKFNNLISNASAEDMADVLSELSCEMCLCREYCDNTKNGDKSCQSVIASWLNEEVR